MPLRHHRPRRFGEHPRHDRLRRRAGERRIAGQHLVEHRAERVHVGARGDLALAHRLLRRHVVRRAERHAGLGHPAAAGLAGGERDAEVGDQRPIVVQQDVLGLDVAVDDAVPVGVVERVGDLARDPDGVGDRELLLAAQPVAQRLALDERHDVEEAAVRLARVEQRQDVRVLQIRRQLDLGEEPLGADHRGELGTHELERDLAVVPEILGQVYGRHSAGPDLAFDPVAVRQRALEAAEELGHVCSGWVGALKDGGVRWDW